MFLSGKRATGDETGAVAVSAGRLAGLRSSTVLRADDEGKPALLRPQFGNRLQQKRGKHHHAQNGETGAFRS